MSKNSISTPVKNSHQNPLIHLGIIADGNRRWAKQNGLPSIEGHKKGIEVIDKLVQAAVRAGIKYLTFYVFSTENWGRSEAEVSYIMKLASTRIPKYAEKMKQNNARLVVLGSRERIEPALAQKLAQAEELTASCTGITVGFCFNYGGEQEIADAAKAVAEAGEDFTPETLRAHIYHPEIPNLDMVVRTSGEERISGFMLLRSAYAEFLFLKKYFPEMAETDIADIVSEYNNRQRRFGK